MGESERLEKSDPVKREALRLGFHGVGVATAGPSAHADRYLEWLQLGRNASMDYMARNVANRIDPRETLDGARSVIVVTLPYDDSPPFPDPGDRNRGRISRYARGRDYHRVMAPMLKKLREFIDCGGKWRSWYSVDTSPILERDWAETSGVGWIGKNGLVIDPEIGSWFFLGTVVTNRGFAADEPAADHCGSCRRCVDACPTGAIVEERTIDARRCISYLTIEHRGEFPSEPSVSLNNWLFGCDICQEVCPWNTRSSRRQPEIHPDFQPRPLQDHLESLLTISEEDYLESFSSTAIPRTGRSGISRNARRLIEEAQGSPSSQWLASGPRSSWFRSAGLIYGSLTLLALILITLRGGTVELEALAGTDPGVAAGAGIIAAASLLILVGLAGSLEALRQLETMIEGVIGRISHGEALALAAMSAVGEEFFFRGALQPFLGLTLTSVLFACCHLAPRGANRWTWPILALPAGFVFGWLQLTTGGLVAPVVAHFLFNWVQLTRLATRSRG